MNIIVTNTKGGSGKTMLVTILAQFLDADIMDIDPQGTLRVSSHFTRRNKPIENANERTKPCLLIDTPPYNFEGLKSFIGSADLILIPAKLQYADLLALRGVYDHLKDLKVLKKALLIFNEVRKPHNSNYRELKDLYCQNYGDLPTSKVELTQLIGFSNSLAKPVTGKALDLALNLIKELKVPKKLLKYKYRNVQKYHENAASKNWESAKRQEGSCG